MSDKTFITFILVAIAVGLVIMAGIILVPAEYKWICMVILLIAVIIAIAVIIYIAKKPDIEQQESTRQESMRVILMVGTVEQAEWYLAHQAPKEADLFVYSDGTAEVTICKN